MQRQSIEAGRHSNGAPRRFSRKKKVAAMTVATMTIAGAAFAYWTSTGTGSGSAATGTSVDFGVTSGTATGGPLTPEGDTQTVPFTVTNPGTGVQNLANVTVTVANADGSDWTAITGCTAADYAVAAPTIDYGDIVPGGTAAGTVVVSMNNLGTDQDACKGVVVPLYFAAS